MIDRFEELLHALGIEIGLALHADKLGMCTLKIADAPDVQLECGKMTNTLLIACFICEVPPGKVRENILRDALKTNALSINRGILGFSERNNSLTLFLMLPMEDLDGRKLHQRLERFIDKVIEWKNAVESGTTSSLTRIPSSL